MEARRVEFVEFRPRRGYLELYQRLDIVLDTFPYNGHTTSLDALWMGVPVVKPGRARSTGVARGTELQLRPILGLPELVAHSETEYVSIAESLAQGSCASGATARDLARSDADFRLDGLR